MMCNEDTPNKCKETQESYFSASNGANALHCNYKEIESDCCLDGCISSELSSAKSCNKLKRGDEEYNAIINEDHFSLDAFKCIDSTNTTNGVNSLSYDGYVSNISCLSEHSIQSSSIDKACLNKESKELFATSQKMRDTLSCENNCRDDYSLSNEKNTDLKHHMVQPNNNYNRPGLSPHDSVSTIQTLFTDSSKPKFPQNENKCTEIEDGSSNLSSSLSLRPSMIGSSLIESEDNHDANVINDQTEYLFTSVSSSKLGDTICSSVHTAPTKVQAHSKTTILPPNCPSDSASRHEYNSFLNVGHHLLNSSNVINPSSPNLCLEAQNDSLNRSHTFPCTKERSQWWEKFSEEDWETMKESAKFVFVETQQSMIDSDFNISRSTEDDNLPVVPPSPPSEFISGITSSMESSTISEHFNETASKSQYILSSVFPSEFLCPLCNDLIVGATILDCSCAKNIFCGSCLEKTMMSDDKNTACTNDDKLNAYGEDRSCRVSLDKPACFEQRKYTSRKTVQQWNHRCPSCKTHITRSVPCHTLDIAIMNSVVNTSNGLQKYYQTNICLEDIEHEDVIQFQHDYYYRLQSWREIVLSRHEAASKKRDRRTEILLSLLIQKEEEMFWKAKQDSKSDSEDDENSESTYIFSEKLSGKISIGRTRMIDVAVVVASAAIGLSFLRRN